MLDKVEEEKLRSMLDLFFKYYMSSNQQLLKIMKVLLEYKDKVSSSTLFIQYQLFLLYASEMNLQVTSFGKEEKNIILTWIISKESIFIYFDYLREILYYLKMMIGFM